MSARVPRAVMLAAGTLVLALIPYTRADAQGFAAVITPPRFELNVKAGDRSRHIVEIGNVLPTPTVIRARTTDWKFDARDVVQFEDALAPGSCRPWVAIERRELTIAGGGNYRFRFEIAPPADAPPGECRFALMFEGDEQTVATAGNATLGVTARIGVIVYAAVGDAKPKLEVVGTRVALRNNEPTAIVDVRNSGNAHGRMSGFLSGSDAAGQSLEFNISTLPILPGEMRGLELTARVDSNEPVKVSFPVTIRGKLEWAGEVVPFEQRFVQ